MVIEQKESKSPAESWIKERAKTKIKTITITIGEKTDSWRTKIIVEKTLKTKIVKGKEIKKEIRKKSLKT